MVIRRFTKDYCSRNNIESLRNFNVVLLNSSMKRLKGRRFKCTVDITTDDYKEVILNKIYELGDLSDVEYFKVTTEGRFVAMFDLDLNVKISEVSKDFINYHNLKLA